MRGQSACTYPCMFLKMTLCLAFSSPCNSKYYVKINTELGLGLEVQSNPTVLAFKCP